MPSHLDNRYLASSWFAEELELLLDRVYRHGV